MIVRDLRGFGAEGSMLTDEDGQGTSAGGDEWVSPPSEPAYSPLSAPPLVTVNGGAGYIYTPPSTYREPSGSAGGTSIWERLLGTVVGALVPKAPPRTTTTVQTGISGGTIALIAVGGVMVLTLGYFLLRGPSGAPRSRYAGYRRGHRRGHRR